jgi:hypothetical protein
MEKDEIKTLIKRLIDEANVIAPSINGKRGQSLNSE